MSTSTCLVRPATEADAVPACEVLRRSIIECCVEDHENDPAALAAFDPRCTVRSDLVLRLPTLDEEAEFLRAHHATSPEVPHFLFYYTEGMPFGRYLEVLTACERGEGLPPDHVPSTFLFAFAGPRIVGRTSIRHRLNNFLERVGGHIGYVVVPEFRRQGYATEILRLSLQIAREKLGIPRVLVTCDDDNIGSIRTIERNGGILEAVVQVPEQDKLLRRYWIEGASGRRMR